MKENENGGNETIIIENAEIITEQWYTGEISAIHDGYVFINNIKRGYETIPTNGNVFCPVPKNSKFQLNQLVQFEELNNDRERPDCFRTEKIISITDLEISKKVEQITQLSRSESPYHRLKKAISENDIKKAGKNKPLFEFIQGIAYLFGNGDEITTERIVEFAEKFVADTFAMLSPLNVKCSIQGGIDEDAELKMINDNINLYNESDLQGQAQSLCDEYNQFLKIRRVFNLMFQNNLLTFQSVIPAKYLPELTMAFPVWFVFDKENPIQDQKDDDPDIAKSTKFFCDCVGSIEYSWFFQIYNRRTRPLSTFKGKDIMPPALVKVMNEAKQIFDYIAIMTPYHDIASREWSDPNWLRSIDPLMVGFIKDLPSQVFVLGRWSMTGIFPLLLDSIADTAIHIKMNKHLLSNFRANTWWYRGQRDGIILTQKGKENNNVLLPFANELLGAYDRGLLFEFLRGENLPEESV